jgi:hypothetical protein
MEGQTWPIHRAFMALVVATVMSFLAIDVVSTGRLAFAFVIIVAGAKAGLILWRFMEIDEAAMPVRIVFVGWVVGVSTLVIGLHALS